MKVIHVWPEQSVCREGHIELTAVLELPNGNKESLWYRVPEEYGPILCEGADPFVVALAPRLAKEGEPVRVHGQVSPSLLQNLGEFQAAWAGFIPGLSRVEIRAETEQELSLPSDRDGAIVAFSGGVDSCFSAFRHARGAALYFPRQIKAGLMVHGFDIPLSEPEMFSSAALQSRKLLESLGLELIPMSTNYRDVVKDWTHSYGAGVASCLMMSAGRFREGLIGQGLAYSHFMFLSEGSNPLTDALLSSNSFAVIPDGAEYQRAEKILMMRDWEELRTGLRVCWAGAQKDRNCCKCEKCIRNILTFRVLGLGLPQCFESDVSTKQIDELGPLNEIKMVTQYDNIVAEASRRGLTDVWVKALRRRLESVRRLRRSRIRREIARFPYYVWRVRVRLLRLLGRLPSELEG